MYTLIELRVKEVNKNDLMVKGHFKTDVFAKYVVTYFEALQELKRQISEEIIRYEASIGPNTNRQSYRNII